MDFFQDLTKDSTFIIAEVGVNHNGDYSMAKRLIDESKRIGADAVKFQVYNPSKLCSSIHKKEQIPMLESLELDYDQHAALKDYAQSIGITWFATPFDEDSLTFLSSIDSTLLKVGSGELTHTPLLERIGQTNIPTIISSGGFTFQDVDRALSVLHDGGLDDVAVLHCISQYPADLKNLNLKVIESMKRRYKAHVIGFSDHSKGYVGSVLAASLGARIIEKHITLDNDLMGPDHKASLNLNDFKEFVDMVRIIPSILGDGDKKREKGENLTGRSIVASRNLMKGQVVVKDDIEFKRPGTNLKPYMAHEIIGKTLKKSVNKDDFIQLDDFE